MSTENNLILQTNHSSSQRKSSPKGRILYYDILNIMATLGVTFLHCNSLAHSYSNTLAWYQALFIEVAVYWPVPIFFMLSGATLIGYRKRYTTKDFFKKRIIRTFIPFIIWSLIATVEYRLNPLNTGFRIFIDSIFNTSIQGVYWFFIPLFSIYLAIPVLSLLKEHRNTLWYLAASTFLLTSLLPPLFNYLRLTWNYSLQMPMAGGYLLFVILGYLFSTQDLTRNQRIGIYILGISGAVLRYGMTVYLSVRDGIINKLFFSYTEYHSVFLAIAVFIFIKNSTFIKSLENNEKVTKIISTLSGCSFGVYLMHIFIRDYLYRVLPASFLDFKMRLLGPFIIYSIGVIITFILKKIPILKHIVP